MKRTRKGSWLKSLSLGMTGALVALSLLGGSAASVQSAPVTEGIAPFDAAIANIDRLASSLEQRGVIPAGLDPATREAKVYEYLNRRAQAAGTQSAKFSSHGAKAQKLRQQAGLPEVAPAQAQPWNGGTRTDRILVLLVEYADFAHNNIQASETDMYYADYPTEHYQQMIFGDNGYTGPGGENLISMKQYYLQQSGGSYSVEGTVAGWFTLPGTAAYYGGNDAAENDLRPRSAVFHALQAAVANGVNLADYDIEDQYDLDGDGNLREPDGLVDHLMVIHSGVGEEAGGGNLGADAIWSHSWDLGGVYVFPGTTASVPYWGGMMGAYTYTIEPEDGATGVFAHEFGHDLGLPDEYDTIYSGRGEPISFWSIMSSGSWAGTIGGTEPVGFSAYAKEFFQASMGGNWQHGTTLDFASLPKSGVTVTLDQAVTKGANEDVVRINLPDQVVSLAKPAAGSYVYWGGKADEMDNRMVAGVDLTGAASATLDYDVWYDLETNWDYSMVQVSTNGGATWTSLSTPNTNSNLVPEGYPAILENLPGYTGRSGGWLHESIDLSAYAGQSILLQFRSMSDWATTLPGFLVDNVKVTVNGTTVLEDGAEGAAAFTMLGFAKNTGTYTIPHYYLVEWRNHAGVDMGLAHIARGNGYLSFDPGMVIWYVNGAYDNNWTGAHPGYGYLGVVDAHQNIHRWGGNVNTGILASTQYHIRDAAFSLVQGTDLDVSYGQGAHLYQAAKKPMTTFDDKTNYFSPANADAGLKLPTYGLKIQVLGEAADRSAATILISK